LDIDRRHGDFSRRRRALARASGIGSFGKHSQASSDETDAAKRAAAIAIAVETAAISVLRLV